MDATCQRQTSYKAQHCEMETGSPAALKDTVTQTGVPNEFSSEEAESEKASLDMHLDYMIGDGVLCDEEDKEILDFGRKRSTQRTLPEFEFTMKKSPDCEPVTTMTNSNSVAASEPLRSKRQSTLQDFGFIPKRKNSVAKIRKLALS